MVQFAIILNADKRRALELLDMPAKAAFAPPILGFAPFPCDPDRKAPPARLRLRRHSNLPSIVSRQVRLCCPSGTVPINLAPSCDLGRCEPVSVDRRTRLCPWGQNLPGKGLREPETGRHFGPRNPPSP